MEDLLNKIIEESINTFLIKDIDNILNDTNERNLCSRLSLYFDYKLKENSISGYYPDTEYNRKQNGEVKTLLNDKYEIVKINCDLIIHSRGKNILDDNLIAIEMKKSNRPDEEKQDDRIRLIALTKKSFDGVWSADGIAHPEHVCGYKIGVYMELNIRERSCLLEYYKLGKKINERKLAF